MEDTIVAVLLAAKVKTLDMYVVLEKVYDRILPQNTLV